MNIHKKTVYFMNYSIPLALLAAVRTLAMGLNELTVVLRSLICSHFCIYLPSASSDREVSFSSSSKNKSLQVRKLLHIMNRTGASTESWGTPFFRIPSLNFILNALFFRNPSNQRVILGWIPIATIFLAGRR